MDIDVRPPGELAWRDRRVRCALGRGGIRADKSEGDGATPAGVFSLRRVLYRPDRVAAPKTGLSVAPLDANDGWCDDPDDARYNHLVRLPYQAGHEVLWRDDAVYDVIVVIGYNDDPAVAGRGSAVFLHLAQPDYAATEGCVAAALPDLLALLADCDDGARLKISLG